MLIEISFDCREVVQSCCLAVMQVVRVVQVVELINKHNTSPVIHNT